MRVYVGGYENQPEGVRRVVYPAAYGLVEDGRGKVIRDDVAPSYFVECLLYNVANDTFRGDHGDRYINALHWIANSELDSLECQNEQLPLFGDTPEQWSKKSAIELIVALVDLWKNW